MCGISGIINFQSSSKDDELSIEKMNKRLLSRGPDANSIWSSEDKMTFLGHTRLSIIDPFESSNQPLFDYQNNIIITYNGELYNYWELRKELISLGYNFNTNSDTEVIIKLYIHYKEEMFNKMLGMFAFCINDISNKKFLLARDHYGIKPLYYFYDRNKFIFSSQVKSIIENNYIKKEIDPLAVCSFLINGSVKEPSTMYKNVKALDAGNYLIIDDGNLQNYSFYNLADHILEVQNTRNEAISEITLFEESLNNTMKRHITSDVPIALYLSSGVDSTSLLNALNQVSNDKINTITLGFDDYKNTKYDEISQAAQISKNFNTKSFFHYEDSKKFKDLKTNILKNMDQPSIDGINTYLISRYANSLGYKVAISGIGGDELFSGYPTFYDVPRMKKIYENTQYLHRFSNILKGSTRKIFDVFNAKKMAYFYDFSYSYIGAYTLRRALFMPDELYNFLPQSFVKNGLEEFNQTLIDEENLISIKDNISKITYLEFNNYLRNQLLKDADWAGMANSVEIRVPFIDKEFIDSVIKLSIHNRKEKKILKATVQAPLKEILSGTSKKGFMIPVSNWINSKKNSYHDWAMEIINTYEI